MLPVFGMGMLRTGGPSPKPHSHQVEGFSSQTPDPKTHAFLSLMISQFLQIKKIKRINSIISNKSVLRCTIVHFFLLSIIYILRVKEGQPIYLCLLVYKQMWSLWKAKEIFFKSGVDRQWTLLLFLLVSMGHYFSLNIIFVFIIHIVTEDLSEIMIYSSC